MKMDNMNQRSIKGEKRELLHTIHALLHHYNVANEYTTRQHLWFDNWHVLCCLSK